MGSSPLTNPFRQLGSFEPLDISLVFQGGNENSFHGEKKVFLAKAYNFSLPSQKGPIFHPLGKEKTLYSEGEGFQEIVAYSREKRKHISLKTRNGKDSVKISPIQISG